MTWLLIGVLIWIAVAIPVALVIGRSIRLAESRCTQEYQAAHEANFIATDVPPATATEAATTNAAATDAPAAGAPATVAPADSESQPWTGPSTVPFAATRLPWGGQRASGRRAGPSALRTPAAQIDPTAPRQESARD